MSSKRKGKRFQKHAKQRTVLPDSKSNDEIALSQTDPLLDPASQALLVTQQAKKKRLQDEIQLALSKIHKRVDYTLNEYEGMQIKLQSDMDASNIEVIEDPAYLYELLGDPRHRYKYHQKLMVIILDLEEKCDNRERLLSSLYNFFLENQAGSSMSNLHKEDDFDFDDVTSSLESAIDTAQNAAKRLMVIKQEMSKLIAIVAAYPYSKKGRKNLEKVLIKTQEDVDSLSTSLEQVQTKLQESSGQIKQLQYQIELKSQECVKLKSDADEVQFAKDKMSNELKDAHNEIEILKAQLQESKTGISVNNESFLKTTLIAADRNRIEELENQFAQEKLFYQVLLCEKEELENEHQEELKSLHNDFEAEMGAIHGSYEEQLMSLVGKKLFSHEKDNGVRNREANMFPVRKSGLFREEPKYPSSIDHNTKPTVNPLDTPTSESDLDSSTSRRRRWRRLYSVLGKQRLVGDTHHEEDARHELVSNSVVLDELKQEFEFQKKQHNVDELTPKYHKTSTAWKTQLTLNENKENMLMLAVEKLTTTVALLEEEKHTLEDQVTMLEVENAELMMTHAKTQSALETQQFLVNEQDSSFARGEDSVFAQWSEPELEIEDTIKCPQAGASPMNYASTLHMCEVQEGLPMQLSEGPSPSPTNSAVGPNISTLIPPSLPQQSHELTHDHPVMIEWFKLCEAVRVFRDSMIGVLCLSGRFYSVADDLLGISLYSIDKSQDVHGEAIAARVCLSLLLNQLTLSLTDVLAQITNESLSPIDSEEDLRVTVRKRLKDQENMGFIETEKSKDRTSSQPIKVNNLKAELVSLRRSMAFSQTDKDSAIMFTRLDSDRNKHILKTAVEQSKISSSTYNKVVEAMKDFLSIADQRMANLTLHVASLSHVKRLVNDVERSYESKPTASNILDGLSDLQQRRKLKFSIKMDHLALKRLDLAYMLSRTLQHIEKYARVSLIKPIFSKLAGLEAQSMIFPMSRPLPIKKTHIQSENSMPFPSTRLINRLLQSRQDKKNSESGTRKHSIPMRKRQTHHTPPTARTPVSSDVEWSMESIYPPLLTARESLVQHFSPIHVQPRNVEINIGIERHQQSSLGPRLPKTIHSMPPNKEKVVKSPSQVHGTVAPNSMRVALISR